jgi:hypothetical protein
MSATCPAMCSNNSSRTFSRTTGPFPSASSPGPTHFSSHSSRWSPRRTQNGPSRKRTGSVSRARPSKSSTPGTPPHGQAGTAPAAATANATTASKSATSPANAPSPAARTETATTAGETTAPTSETATTETATTAGTTATIGMTGTTGTRGGTGTRGRIAIGSGIGMRIRGGRRRGPGGESGLGPAPIRRKGLRGIPAKSISDTISSYHTILKSQAIIITQTGFMGVKDSLDTALFWVSNFNFWLGLILENMITLLKIYPSFYYYINNTH